MRTPSVRVHATILSCSPIKPSKEAKEGGMVGGERRLRGLRPAEEESRLGSQESAVRGRGCVRSARMNCAAREVMPGRSGKVEMGVTRIVLAA
eukprot:356316-Chlamydomonas_euryale.AAC.2